ncbi:intraflagellar transport protein 52 homolog [Paramacrobiotus metropolitanus]|uniref:intraflagellar transport protein 52 homolog n=1 Tax=Paramacrobiotus metropolitanus TaxID=2943436 RepID=UPI0024462477|nr:intraflagellar transport protein 52 homolog [Paramacrobiotus metropolitanus]
MLFSALVFLLGVMSAGSLAPLPNIAIFIEGKDEPYTAADGYTKLAAHLAQHHNLQVRRSYLDNLDPDDLEQTVLVLVAGPRRPFTASEFQCLKTFITLGINVLFLAGEGGQHDLKTNLNSLLSDYGVTFARDSVVRSSPRQYLHPKEALIHDGVIESSPLCAKDLQFVYPFGCSLEIGKPAIPVLTSGKCCFPPDRGLCALSQLGESHGKVACFGSLYAFHDQYIEKEENAQLLNSLLNTILTTNEVFHEKISTFPDFEDIPARPQRQFVIPKAVRAEPLFDEAFELPEKTIRQLMEDQVENEFGKNFRLEAALIEAGQRLGISWDVNSVRMPPKIKGYLPKMVYPTMPPEVRLAGAPTLELFDLDQELFGDKATLEKLFKDGGSREEIVQKAGKLFGLGQEGVRPNSKDILRRIVDTVLRGRTSPGRDDLHFNPKPCSQNRPRSSLSSCSARGDIRRETTPPISLERIVTLMAPSHSENLPLTDEQILHDCLARRRCGSPNKPKNIFL